MTFKEFNAAMVALWRHDRWLFWAFINGAAVMGLVVVALVYLL